MSEYGYIPESPEQSFGNNKGIFTPKDIYDLTRADKYTNYGQLELIHTENASSVSSVEFKSSTGTLDLSYNVHFLTINNFKPSNDNAQLASQVSFNDGSSYTANAYQFAYQQGKSGGTFAESRTNDFSYLRIIHTTGNATNESGNGYCYFYNLSDNTKFSFQTTQQVCMTGTPELLMQFGSGLFYPNALVFDALKIYSSAGTFSATASLYGIRYS
jgi:hypothetical protein